MPRHLLTFDDWSRSEIQSVVDTALRLKAEVADGQRQSRLANHLLALIFETPSTRTRQSFTGAMNQCGGFVSEVNFATSQMAKGETFEDTARAIGGYADAIVMRTTRHQLLDILAAESGVPVINGLSERAHPCQVLADLLTFREIRGDIAGEKIAWVGDCNNVARSWAQAAHLCGAALHIACPPSRHADAIDSDKTAEADFAAATFAATAADACADAALVMTDTWVSIGDSAELSARRAVFQEFAVDAALMARARPDALFMHCLPAMRGAEVTAEVIDGAQSAVWQQAGNRLHAQKALLLHLLERL